MTFGAALSLRVSDFRRLTQAPLAPFIGLLAQFFILPAITGLLTWAANIEAELALGMILVACCPGGNFSNIMTWLARGDVAVSVTMTAVSSVVAIIATPLNFAFYTWLNPATRELATQISLDAGHLLSLVLLVLALPLILGMLTSHYWPRLSKALQKPLRLTSIAVLILFIGIGFASHVDVFLEQADRIVLLAVLHNSLALILGALAASAARLPDAARRAVTMEVGIQNTGLGLIIAFNFFPDAAGAILLIAFWGVPHLVSGMGLIAYWGRRPPVQ